MRFQGLILAGMCLLTLTAHAQNAVENLLSPPQPPPPAPQPVVPPVVPTPAPGVVPPGPCPYDPQITAADCPGQSCYAGLLNGCGSSSLTIISDKIVPDTWPAGVNFNDSCNVHDMCYNTPGSQKNDCDNKFHQALLAECNRALGCTNFPVVGQQCYPNPTNNPLYGPCKGLADLYFNAVQDVGQGPFNQDQQQAKAYADQCHQKAAQRGAGR